MESSDSSGVGDEDVEIVREYLIALEEHKPRRGRPKDWRRVERDLAEVERLLGSPKADADPLRKLTLVQRRLDLIAELEQLRRSRRLEDVTQAFIAVVASYSTRNGISFEAWRELGVPVSVLARGGVSKQ